MGLELLAVVVSLAMAEKADLDSAGTRQRMHAAIEALIGQMARQPAYHSGLSGGAVGLHGWLDAAGAALVTDRGVKVFGATPSEADVARIAFWLNAQDDQAPVFATDRLAQLCPAAATLQATAAGLLAARLMRGQPECVLWFRPETVRTIDWAGDPHKPVQVDVVDGRARLTPRGSFELWKESVAGRSQPWLDCEVEAAGALRRAIAERVLVQLNTELRTSNAELDSFAYAASHDLKEPLRGIHNFARFLQRSAGKKLTAEEDGRIETIIRLARRMDELTDGLLEYSRIGRTEYPIESVDLNEVLKQTLEVLETRIAQTGAVVSLPRPFPTVQGSRVPLANVFDNLLSNALKYNDRPAGEQQIEIGWRDDTGGRVFYVRDNGIGIALDDLDQVFRIFRRLHGRGEYGGGIGAGLTIARHTMERLGGRLWAESDGPGHGTTFLLCLGGTHAEPAS
jgi:light-regulated signal transduction histidine kinase (bacteriophytochrome)